MHHQQYSTINPETGNVEWNGPLSITNGSHAHMPSRTTAYEQSDIRFHLNASSLGGVGNRTNVVPGNNDVDKIAWTSVENGERDALRSGTTIDSVKTAVANGQLRPAAFTCYDRLTYADGHTEVIRNSFANIPYEEQQLYNDNSAAVRTTFDAPNPSDGLRSAMTIDEYAALMDATDAELPGIRADYAAADFSGIHGTGLDAPLNNRPETKSISNGDSQMSDKMSENRMTNLHVSPEEFSSTVKGAVDSYYEHELSLGASQQQAMEAAFPMAEDALTAIEEFDAAQACAASNEAVQETAVSVEANAFEAEAVADISLDSGEEVSDTADGVSAVSDDNSADMSSDSVDNSADM